MANARLILDFARVCSSTVAVLVFFTCFGEDSIFAGTGGILITMSKRSRIGPEIRFW